MNKTLALLAAFFAGAFAGQSPPAARGQYPGVQQQKTPQQQTYVYPPLVPAIASYFKPDAGAYGDESPPRQQQGGGADDEWKKRIEGQLAELNKKLDFVVAAVKSAQQGEGDPAGQPPDGAQAQANPDFASGVEVCRACHSAQSAGNTGGGYAMFDSEGRLRRPSQNQLDELIRRVDSKDPASVMPPARHPKQLTPRQREAILADLRKAKGRPPAARSG